MTSGKFEKYGYHRSWCDYCERITDHEDTKCLICGKLDGESVEDFEEELSRNTCV